MGTIGALANWSIPIAAITHIMSSKDPATTIDPTMTTGQTGITAVQAQTM